MNLPAKISFGPIRPFRDRLPSRLFSRKAFVVFAALAIGLGAALNWSWLTAARIAPMLLSALPCAAMCALGLCMKRMTASPNHISSSALSEFDAAGTPSETMRTCCASRESAVTTLLRR